MQRVGQHEGGYNVKLALSVAISVALHHSNITRSGPFKHAHRGLAAADLPTSNAVPAFGRSNGVV